MQSLGKTCRNETKMTEAAAESGKIAKALKKYLIRRTGLVADCRNHLGDELHHLRRRQTDQPITGKLAAPAFLGVQHSRLGIVAATVVCSLPAYSPPTYWADGFSRMGQPFRTHSRRQIHLLQR